MSHPVSNDAAPPPIYGAEGDLTRSSGRFWVLTLGSIGVVFGDIGTSPLYSLQTALGQFKGPLGPPEVIGVVSLIIWALLIVVTAKYVLFLMLADNKGEGGILSLKALAQRALGQKSTLISRPTSYPRPSSSLLCCSPPRVVARPESRPSSARSWWFFSPSTLCSESCISPPTGGSWRL
jgi:hypothetical protein